MAKVANMAEIIPLAPVCAYASIFCIVAAFAKACFLSKPQIGCIFIPFALLLTSAEIASAVTEMISKMASTV